MFRLALVFLLSTVTCSMAIQRAPKIEGPQVREKTEIERWEETPSAQAAQHVFELYMRGDREGAKRQLEIYKRQFGGDREQPNTPALPPLPPFRGPGMMPDEWNR